MRVEINAEVQVMVFVDVGGRVSISSKGLRTTRARGQCIVQLNVLAC
jgi:hypothetical protein